MAADQNRKPKNIYIAHRLSPSDLTSLMVEQYNLQRQLENVQTQQNLLVLQNNQGLQPPDALKSHNRLASNGHRRTGSLGTQGHTRRHSLGLNEAIKAAASQKQSNMASMGNTTVLLTDNSPVSPQLSGHDNVASFKFPNTPDSDRELSPAQKPLAYGQQSFKFPPDNNSLLPPTPNFGLVSPERSYQRRGSHIRTNSRNPDPNHNINSNWRSQQLPMGGHQRNSLNNNLSPPSFVPGHKNRSSSLGGGNSSISSLSHFMPQGNNGNGRKSLFAPYLPQSLLAGLFSEGRIVTGTLRVNKKNRSDAYVTSDLLDADIFICGSKDRNRALEGDLVAVELLVVDEVWEAKKEKEEKKRRKDNISTKSNAASVLSDDIHNDATSTSNADSDKTEQDGDGLGRRGSLKQRPTMKKNDDVEVEGQSLLLVEEEEINDEVKPLYAGHVVAVVDRIPGQIFSGTLGLLRPAQAAQVASDKISGKELSFHTPKAPKIVWFKPTDKRVPLIAIPTEQAPRDFVENHESYADLIFIASIKRWPITSLHPFGTLVNRLGKVDDPAVEIDAILRDNNFMADEYPSEHEMTKNYLTTYFDPLPSIEDELNNSSRTKFVNEYLIAFTQNGQFADHALHVKRLDETKIELGFHCVDVSFFVKPGSSLERKAKRRSVSVFLPQKVLHLFPQEFNNLLSFKVNEQAVTLSVVFEIDTTNFSVENISYHNSIIQPKALVSYDAMDSVLNNLPTDFTSATCDYLKTYSLIAKEFRRQRLDDRAIGVSPSLALLDQLDDEKVKLNMNIFEGSMALLVISEITHKVNLAVAKKIAGSLGGDAFLRRQPVPTLQKMEAFARKAANLGYKIDTSSSASLQKSILAISDATGRQCVETLLFKCMPKPRYYTAKNTEADQYGHYYINVPVFTHFSAPLRRFADLMVHRQLKSVISGDINAYRSDEDSPKNSDDLLKSTADYCNFKMDCAANAQEQALHILLSQTINEMSKKAGQLLVMGTVIQIYESSFDVLIPEFGIEKRVHGDQLPLVKAEFDKNKRVLELYWDKGVDSATYIPADEKSSLSYRLSVKNKERTSAVQVAKLQSQSMKSESTIATPQVLEKFAALSITAPAYKSLSLADDDNILGPYLAACVTRVEDKAFIQEVRELTQVPILLRAEIGMSSPCLTVRALNPFA